MGGSGAPNNSTTRTAGRTKRRTRRVRRDAVAAQIASANPHSAATTAAACTGVGARSPPSGAGASWRA